MVFQTPSAGSEGLSGFDWVAVYAAIVATAALGLEILRWWQSGVRLDIRVTSRAVLAGSPNISFDQEWLSVTIVNNGDRGTTIGDLYLYRLTKRWFLFRKRERSRQALVITDAAFALHESHLPAKLPPSAEWTGMIDWNVVKDALSKQHGQLYLAVHSYDKRKLRFVRIEEE